jgi:outer membrane lipoprotein-sorting protein
MNLKTSLSHTFAVTTILVVLSSLSLAVTNEKADLPAKSTKKSSDSKLASKSASKIEAVSDAEIKILKTLDSTYQKKSASMNVERTTKIALLEQERKANGKLWVSGGQLRMELDGEEKTLLVVNKKNLWAVTFPSAEFKDTPVQVIKADASSKKGRSKNLVALLSQGGFLKFFLPTAVEKQQGGDVMFFLSPRQEQGDIKRAQVRVTAEGKKHLALNYWDDRDNEVKMNFTDVKFEKSFDEKLFNYAPPPNAQLMNL